MVGVKRDELGGEMELGVEAGSEEGGVDLAGKRERGGGGGERG